MAIHFFSSKPPQTPPPPMPQAPLTQSPHVAQVQCRGVWASLSSVPAWMKEGLRAQVVQIEEEASPEIGRDDALTASLKRVFEAAFMQSEAVVWMPVILTDRSMRKDLAETAWQQAIEASNIAHFPPQPDCRTLPGTASAADRAIDLFENTPHLPAALIVGMDAPDIPGAARAASAVLFARPGLSVPLGGETDLGEKQEEYSPYTPHWERHKTAPRTDWSQWGNIPPALVANFLRTCPSIATLYKTSGDAKPGVPHTLTEQIRAAVIAAHAEELIGGLAHDCDSGARFNTLNSALTESGCKTAPVGGTGNICKAYGNVGMARPTLMLAGAVLCAAQLDKPVLVAESGEGGSMAAWVASPAMA